jgi:hypothetical protein
MNRYSLLCLPLILTCLLFWGCGKAPDLIQSYQGSTYPRLPDPPPTEPLEDVSKLNLREFWGLTIEKGFIRETEIVSGDGYCHVEFSLKDKDKGIYEAKMQKSQNMKVRDNIREGKIQETILFKKDLSFVSSELNMVSNASANKVDLRTFSVIEGNILKVSVSGLVNDKKEDTCKTYPLTEAVYHTGLLSLLPVFKGVAIGQKYEVMVLGGAKMSQDKLEKITFYVESFEKVGDKNCYKISYVKNIRIKNKGYLWITAEGELVENLELFQLGRDSWSMTSIKNEGPVVVKKYLMGRE